MVGGRWYMVGGILYVVGGLFLFQSIPIKSTVVLKSANTELFLNNVFLSVKFFPVCKMFVAFAPDTIPQGAKSGPGEE